MIPKNISRREADKVENIKVKSNSLMDQYTAAKARYPKHILLFRVGDFYEAFNEDAKLLSRVLGLTLTNRDKGQNPVPMAGIPVHSAEPYVARLLRQGFSVATAEFKP